MTTSASATIDLVALPARSATPTRTPLTLLRHQMKFELLSLVRNRQARFFTLAMPVGFLVLFCAIFGNGVLHGAGQANVRSSTYYVANLTTFGIVDVAFMSLVAVLVDTRESGVLRRRQATPQPAWVIVAGRAIITLLVASLIGVLLLLIGRVAYGASVPLAGVPSLLVSVVVASVAFVSLGFAISGIVRSVQSVQPTVMGVAMPLFFISGIFIPWVIIPTWLRHVAAVFPMRHLSTAILTPFTSYGGQSTWSGTDLLIVATWGAAGLIVALRTFKWAPQDI
ncbi:MAG TPA: ABC transporter permease [Acidimicrobiales bacterium]|nr:ABC transporter permease [Acidimicrobiales bacterium]